MTSTPLGISCPGDCTEDYPNGTVVTLPPTPSPGWRFDHWDGDADCTDGQVTMDVAKTCTAIFTEVCPECLITSGLVVGTALGGANDLITMPVEVRNAPNAADALGFQLRFDSSKLAFIGCDFTDTLLQTWDFKGCNTLAPGVVQVGAFTSVHAIPTGASGTMVKVTFDVGMCTEGEKFSLGLQNPVDDVARWASCGGCVGCNPCNGDVDNSGEVPPRDAQIVFECFLGKQPCTPEEHTHGDITRDGQLTPGDGLCLFNKYLGKPPTPDCLCFLAP